MSQKKKTNGVKGTQVRDNLRIGAIGGNGGNVRVSKKATNIVKKIVNDELAELGVGLEDYLQISQKKTITSNVLFSVLNRGKLRNLDLKEILQDKVLVGIPGKMSTTAPIRALGEGIPLGKGTGFAISKEVRVYIPMIAKLILQIIGKRAYGYTKAGKRKTISETDVKLFDFWKL